MKVFHYGKNTKASYEKTSIEHLRSNVSYYYAVRKFDYAVWKFEDFSVNQILRGINFGESRSSKTTVFAILGALNFVDLVNFHLQKVQ